MPHPSPQHVVVIGAGVVGVSVAHRLARDGMRVQILEQLQQPALQTSFANGGQLVSVETEPWIGPGALSKALKWSLSPNAPFKLKPRFSTNQWRWLMLAAKQRRPERFQRAWHAVHLLAQASAESFQRVRQNISPHIPDDAFRYRNAGLLVLYDHINDARNAQNIARQNLGSLRKNNDAHVLTPQQCINLEPSLAPAVEAGVIGGALHSPQERIGDAHLFTQALAQLFQDKLNGEFHPNVHIKKLIVQNHRVVAAVDQNSREWNADAFVIAAGVHTPRLLKPLGFRIPIEPVAGYSLTLPLSPDALAHAPSVGLTWRPRRNVFSRLGNNLRVAGFAHLGHRKPPNPKRAARVLNQNLQRLFPLLSSNHTPNHMTEDTKLWSGLRPMTPDCVPFVGALPSHDNLLLAAGHGSLGWTLAHATADAVADALAGRPNPVLASLSLDRFLKKSVNTGKN